jgi:hypothetical protein
MMILSSIVKVEIRTDIIICRMDNWRIDDDRFSENNSDEEYEKQLKY